MPTPATEQNAIKPQVFVDGLEATNVHVVAIEDNFGSLPSKCVLRWGNDPTDVTGPITLNGNTFGTANGQRIEIVDGSGNRIFCGNLLKRQDQGSAQNVLWTAYCDKVFLQQIPMRGCIIDNGDQVPKFIERFDPRMNPDGLWNAIGILSPLDGTTVVPVFTSQAALSLVYTSPDFQDPVELEEGDIVPWTPRLALKYLWFCSQLAQGDIDGLDDKWRSIAPSDRISWEISSINDLVGTDVPLAQDPLDRKLPDMQLRGTRMLAAIAAILEAAGTHDLQLTYQDDGVCVVGFQPISFSAFSSPGGDTPAVNLVRGGTLDTADTLYDFDLNDDATTVCEAALVEAAVIHVEASLTNDPSEPFNSVQCIHPAWTAEEEASWLVGVNGGTGPINPEKYAKYPAIQGADYTVSPYAEWLTADGDAGRPFAASRSEAAFQLLWGHFPYVYRGFTVNSDELQAGGVMAGYNSQYEDVTKYPVLSYNRPILPAQLQFFLNNPSGGTTILNWLKSVYPIRIRLQQPEDGNYFEVPVSVQVRVSGNGVFWLDGLQTSLNGHRECIYEGDLTTEPLGTYVDSDGHLLQTRLKDMVINCCVPMDHRVQGYAEVDAGESILTISYRNQLGGPPLYYVDSPDAYHETHQVNSQPGAINTFYGGPDAGDTVSSPLNRLLPPGSESPYADYAAQRKLYQNKLPLRNGMFRLCGIRTDFRAGMWLGSIIMVNSANPDDSNYVINAPIRSILHDFMSQSSTLGGIANASSAYTGPRGGAVYV